MAAARRRRRHLARRPDALHRRLPPGAGGGPGGPLRASARMYEDALFMSNLFAFLAIPTGGERAARRSRRARRPAARPGPIELDRRLLPLPGQARSGRCATSRSRSRPARSSGSSARTAPGKSTLVKLLLRLYDPTEGAIRYGGVDLRDMDPRDLRDRDRRRVPGLRPLPVHRRREHRPRRARATSTIGPASRRPRGAAAPRRSSRRCRSGYDTVARRLVRARATSSPPGSGRSWRSRAPSCARTPRCSILDEPTASIDAEAEHELFQRFRELAADRTAIVISPPLLDGARWPTGSPCSTAGGSRSSGTHRELVAQGGRYAHLFHLQAQGYLD